MKRFHVHVGVKNLDESIKFYSTLFGQKPSKLKEDYAKWMLEDPRINFAISTRVGEEGVDHLGFQVDESSELGELTERLKKADLGIYDEGTTTCCYANSEKAWVKDPSGIAWETYHTMNDVEVFNEKPKKLQRVLVVFLKRQLQRAVVSYEKEHHVSLHWKFVSLTNGGRILPSFVGDRFNVYSAGTKKHGMNERAVKVMKEIGIDISSHYSKTVEELPMVTFDYVVTVCDAAKETCPYFPGGKVIHVGFPDPPAMTKDMTDEEEVLKIYRKVRDEIGVAIKNLPSLLGN